MPVHDIIIVQGLANAHITIIGHHISRMTSVPPKKSCLKIWVMHPLNRVVLFSWSESDQFQNIHRGISSIHSLSRVRLFATPWISVRQASLSNTMSWSSLKLKCIESVMPSSHLIHYRPLLLMPRIPPRIKVFSNESTLCKRWPKYWSFSFSITASKNTQGWPNLGWTAWVSLQSKGLSSFFSNTTVQTHQYFSAQLSSQFKSCIHTWPLEKQKAWLDRSLLAKYCLCFSICYLGWS